MKLNKFILGHISVFLGVICMFFVTACSDNEGDDSNPVIPPTLSISPEAAGITFSAKATESFTYTVTTNQLSWDVKIG